ncbi:MAG: NERD domain-containing protein [Lachnospiraceae bacterium]|nr:NERD domain-containing protein [Lachnospiraceae bacterium]
MDLFRKKIGPVFVKKDSDVKEYIEKLESLKERADGNLKEEIEKQIKWAKSGHKGEENIAFELQNSGMDMMILHDLLLEINEVSAQIDYLVITRKVTFVIECKNLIGNIEINNKGEFIRTYKMGGEKVRQGFYSPITQNERHLQVIKQLRLNEKGTLARVFAERNFNNCYKSIVVLANPQTLLYDRYAPKEIKEKVIRSDQLVEYIKGVNAESGLLAYSENEMKELADFFLSHSRQNKLDYIQKYENRITKTLEKEEKEEKEKEEKNTGEIEKCLKEFRLTQSRKENIPPYYIFNDAQLQDLIKKEPGNEEELLKVSGFGPVKVKKYGEEILRIMKENK